MTAIEKPVEPTAEIPAVDYNPYLSTPILGHVLEQDHLREQFRAFRSTMAPGWYNVTRLDDVREGLQHPEIFSSTAVVPLEPDPPYKWIPEMVDPPEHTRWRQLLSPVFSPTAIEAMADKVRTRCIEIIEPLVERGHCDFLRDFAWRYPTTIFMDLMGLPVSEADQFMSWEHDILHLTADQDPDRSKAYAAMTAVTSYFADLIADRRKHPTDDLLSRSLTWSIDGKPITDEDLGSFCLLMFMAGLDTVSIQLSYSFHHLATHDADRVRVSADPAVIPQAVEELLRAYSFVVTGRKAMTDTEIAGCPVGKGEMVSFWIPAACRDPRAFPNADVVDFDRTVNNHIAFGAGPHRCLGSHLARRELRVAMEEWHKRIPNYRLDPDVPVTEHGGMFGVDSLALRWD